MRCLVGLDDTDSSQGFCTTYLAYRIAVDLRPELKVVPYPRLVRLNPNVPFKTRGNAAVCLEVETDHPDRAFELLSSKVSELSDVAGGANSGMVFLEDTRLLPRFRELYYEALFSMVSPDRVRGILAQMNVRHFELGNGMGIVGAASSLGFDEDNDHTYELISYRTKTNWGTKRSIESSSVKLMDAETFPHTFNNYDYQKRKVLVAPHGPDPVFAGVRGDSPEVVVRAFEFLEYEEVLEGQMVYVSNQHTDAHLSRELDWKVFSSGWSEGTVTGVTQGPGGHVYVSLNTRLGQRLAAAYEPTGDLRSAALRLRKGDPVRVSGGIRRGTSRHSKILNVEKLETKSSRGGLPMGTYISSPRANRHLTKPLVRYGRENFGPGRRIGEWLVSEPTRQPALARSL